MAPQPPEKIFAGQNWWAGLGLGAQAGHMPHRCSSAAWSAILLLTAGPAWAQVQPAGGPAETQWGPLRLWNSVFAGRSSLAGDARTGTQSVVASISGMATGADIQLDRITLLGGSIGLSHQTFSSGSGNGDSNDVTFTLYGRHTLFDRAYFSEALGYGWHDVETQRTLFSANDFLKAQYRSHDIGGRIEGGYGFTLGPASWISPYAAFVGDSYHQPAYGETSSSHSSIFAASYKASSIAVTHIELGSRYGDDFTLAPNRSLSIDALVAWEHELDDNPLVEASFETEPGTDFLLRGTKPAADTALIGAGLRYWTSHGFTVGTRIDARLGQGTTIFSGTADLTYLW
jgi:outer membrane autotransporter protein